MSSLPESTVNLLLSSLIGVISTLTSIFINVLLLQKSRRDEQLYQHKLDIVAKERELFLQHRLEMKRREQPDGEIAELKAAIKRLEQRLSND
jgi:hypothetical protein